MTEPSRPNSDAAHGAPNHEAPQAKLSGESAGGARPNERQRTGIAMHEEGFHDHAPAAPLPRDRQPVERTREEQDARDQAILDEVTSLSAEEVRAQLAQRGIDPKPLQERLRAKMDQLNER